MPCSRQSRAVAALLDGGADANARNPKTGNTALMLAANFGVLGVVQALVAAGAGVNARADDSWMALAAARMIGDDETAAFLRRAWAND